MLASKLTREVELFENQRYVFTKFSSSSLLPTDRRAYSTECGTISWSTTEEAENALLTPGWNWVPEGSLWTTDKDFPNTDPDGWSYDVDFGSFQNASAQKKMIHFVRRRRLTRIQDFDVSRIGGISKKSKIPITCDHCDLSEIENIDAELLKKIAEMTLRVDPSKLPLAPVVNPIKAKMISDIMDSESLGLPKLYETIQNFTVPGQSTWGKMFTHKDRSENDLPARVEEMKSGSFDERALVAQVIIRKHDIAFDVHCDKAGCGSSCVFAPQACSNHGCDIVFSKKWAERHDAQCPHKVIPCTRVCGDNFPRKHLQKHLDSVCPLRPVPCPFSDLGCSADLLSKDVAAHLDSCGHSHLLLAVERVRELQTVVKSLNGRVNDVESDCSRNTGLITALTASVALSFENLEKKTNSRISEESSKVEGRLNDKISKVGTQAGSIQSSVQNLEKQIKPIIDQFRK